MGLWNKLSRLFTGGAADYATLEKVQQLLVEADFGVAATNETVDRLSKAKRVDQAALEQIVVEQLGPPATPLARAEKSPTVILVFGVNGTGKTTTVGKLAQLLKASGKTPLVVAADTFRAAAVEQLEIWTRRAGVDLIRARDGSDPASVVFDAIVSGKARGRDPILVDTAGRLHTKVNLMNELEKIRRVAAREVSGAPHEVLLVLDATVGQNGLTQAREFMNIAGVNGVVLTKLDGTAKGGIAVAIACELKLPIRYVGVGESIDDLVPFSVDEYVDALFEQKF